MAPLDFSRPVLVLEAATSAGSVAVLRPDVPPLRRGVVMGAGAADGLFPAVVDLLGEAALAARDLGAVVCGAGPGSFTSLRIAAALAKGLASGAKVPLYAVPSLALAAAALPGTGPAGPCLIHADALRGERYILEVDRHPDGRISWTGVPTRSTVEALRSSPRVLVSVGPSPAALLSPWEVWPDASAVSHVVGPWSAEPVDLARWEPWYGRLAEAQVQWEATHGRPLPAIAPS